MSQPAIPLEPVAGEEERDAAQPQLGLALRQLRHQRGHSLTTVSKATGISASFLSVVENGRSDITIGRLMGLLSFYGAGIADLLPDESAKERIVTRQGEQLLLRSPGEGVELRLLAPDTNREMMPLLVSHQPGSKVGGFKPHDGETFFHILEGSLLFEREGHPSFVLSAGDSAYIKGNAPPTVTTLGEETGVVLAVVTPPTL
jgi:XRE family transcriptional regulator, regulator of sulfur utilization